MLESRETLQKKALSIHGKGPRCRVRGLLLFWYHLGMELEKDAEEVAIVDLFRRRYEATWAAQDEGDGCGVEA